MYAWYVHQQILFFNELETEKYGAHDVKKKM